MCLAVPAQLMRCDPAQSEAVADLHGNRVRVSTALTPGVKSGDWVLIHAGFVIQRLEPEEAQATWAVLRDAAVIDMNTTSATSATGEGGSDVSSA